MGILEGIMESDMIAYVVVAVVAWNVTTFALYGIDKRRSKKGKWRISEATLIACAFLMGGVGALLGMSVFRHKTKHLKFKMLVPLAIIINIGAAALVKWGWMGF